MYKYGVLIILYHPDAIAFQNIKHYQNIFDNICVYDNTQKERINYTLKNDIAYFSNGNNEGLCVAIEQGIKWAVDKNIDFLLTMDQDSEFKEYDIQIMKRYIEAYGKDNIGIFGTNFNKIYINPRTGQEIHSGLHYNCDKVYAVMYCMTSGSFMNVKKVQELLPLTNLFIGMVDNYIGYELNSRGQKVVIIGKAVLSQRVGSKVRYSKLNKLLHKVILSKERYYYMGRNMCFLEKRYKDKKKIVANLRKIKARIFLNMYFCEEEKSKKIKAWRVGYSNGNKGL